MIYSRRYVQFNELVIDGYDMLQESDGGASFKANPQEYTYGHGSYIAFKNKYMFARESQITMTLHLMMTKLPCEQRPFYRNFVVTELAKPGKLWAVQNNELVWAYAYVSGYAEINNRRTDILEIDLDFVLYEGVWHKADKQKTFLKPYDVCSFFDCKGYRQIQPCKPIHHGGADEGDCCTDCINRKVDLKQEDDCSCCCCDELIPDMALCYHLDQLQSFYDECSVGFQIEYNCSKAEEFFGEDYLGQKFCTADSCSHMIAGRFYSETDIPTTGITLIIDGSMHNPSISINGNTNIIKGDYEGALIIKPSGDVYHKTDCCEDLLSPTVWSKPIGEEYGWEVNQGVNSIVINLGECCKRTCVYIQTDNLTI